MNKVTGRFFAPCRRNKETKQPSGLPRLFLRFCMEPRSSEQPPVLPAGGHEAAGWKDRQKTARIPLRSGRFEGTGENASRDRGKDLTPAPGQHVRTGPAGTAHPDPQPVRIKEHWQLLPFCQQLQPSSAAWCSPPPSQMAGRTPHAVSY